MALLNYKAERAIINLRAFLSTLERLDDAHQALPSYNTDPRWANDANKVRRFQDYAAAILALGANAAGLGAAEAIYPQRFAEAPAFFYLSIALALALVSLIGLLITPKWRYSPDR